MSDMQTLRVEIAKLRLSPGDVLVVSADGEITVETARHIKQGLEPLLPDGVKAIVLPDGLKLSVLTQAKITELKAA